MTRDCHQRLTKNELTLLAHDLRKRVRLQRVMSEHTYAVLECELDVSANTIRRIERNGPQRIQGQSLSDAKAQEIFWRRQIVAIAKEEYDEDCSAEAIMKRHNISLTTFKRWAAVVQDDDRQASQEMRKVA